MGNQLYVMFIDKSKSYRRMTKDAVIRHVDNLRRLDDEGFLERCGVFKGYPNVAGMVILRADSYEEAEELCKREPLVVEGFATYRLVSFLVADRENNYLL